jgi:hypothetical protein
MSRNGNRPGKGAAYSVGELSQNAAELSRLPATTQAPDRLVVRLELDATHASLSYRRLRWLLKALIRQHRIRCIGIGPDRGRP